MADVEVLTEKIRERFSKVLQHSSVALGELTIEVPREKLREVCLVLRDDSEFRFEMLLDICGVDYSDYGMSEWVTEKSTSTGFERGVEAEHPQRVNAWNKPRFAAVYHFLSVAHNRRLRMRVFAESELPMLDSVNDIWHSANWYEREAFDLFGIVFNGHPDLRRILTDYGFIGHPFRKDFPLIGNVEVRYDATERRVIYEPVSIPPRTLVPKVIRYKENESNA